MTKFIKLTEVYRDDTTTAILLNCDFIKSIKISDKKTDTHILMSDNKYFFVSESVEQIWLKLNNDPKFIVDVDTGKIEELVSYV